MPVAGSSTQRVHAHQIIGAWGETLLKGRRVAVIGDSSSGLAEQIAANCGRRVHAYDPDATRAAAALAEGRSTKVTYCALHADLDLRGGAYDAVVVPDLDALDDGKAAIRHARELLSPRGLLLLASSAAGALDYYALYDAVADSFEEVTMLGRAPFAGYTVAAFGAEGDPAVMIDSSLVAAPEPPQWFVVAASDQPLNVEGYTLVQLPAAAAAAWVEGPRPELADAAELAEARLQCSLLNTELRRLKDSNEERAQEQVTHQKLQKNLSLRVAELEAELKRTSQETNAKARAERRRLTALEKKLKQTQLALEEVTNGADDVRQQAEDSFQEELDTMLERIADLEEQLETRATAASAKKKRSADAENKAANAEKKAQAAERRAADAERTAQAAQRQAADAEKMAQAAQKQAADVEKTAQAAQKKQAADAEKRAQAAQNKVADAEKTAQAAQKQVADAEKRAQAAQNKVADAEKTAQAAQKQAADAEKRAQAAQKKVADAEKTAQAAQKQAADAEKTAQAAQKKVADAEKVTRAAQTKAKQVARTEKKAERHPSPTNGADHFASEVVLLEEKLQERGAAVVGLKADLQEAERTGRELLARLISMSAETAQAQSSMQQDGLLTTLTSQPDSQRPDADEVAGLLLRCARYEADLQAVNWKAEALTNELAQIQSATPTDVEKLEAALRHTHDELAKLRQQDAASSD